MINKNWKIIISLLLILSIFSKISAQNTNPEPYGKDEFPSWVKDLRRTEIITFGSLPFATLGVTLGYGIIKYANGSSTSIANPFNKSSSQYSLDEQKKILGISCAVSLALGLTDLGVNHITRFIKRKKMQKVNRLKEIEKINIKQVSAEEAGEMLRKQTQLILEKEKIDAESNNNESISDKVEQTEDSDGDELLENGIN